MADNGHELGLPPRFVLCLNVVLQNFLPVEMISGYVLEDHQQITAVSPQLNRCCVRFEPLFEIYELGRNGTLSHFGLLQISLCIECTHSH